MTNATRRLTIPTEAQRECIAWLTDNTFTVGVKFHRPSPIGTVDVELVDRDSLTAYTIHPDGRRDLRYTFDFSADGYEDFSSAYELLNDPIGSFA